MYQHMKKSKVCTGSPMLVLLVVLFSSCVSTKFVPTGVNEIPMYGNTTFTDKQKEANDKFLQDMLTSGYTNESGSNEVVKTGFRYLNHGDFSTSIKRFNQGWLLNPDNPEVYSGFGIWYGKQQEYEKAVEMLSIGIQKDPKHKFILHDIGYTYNMLGIESKNSGSSSKATEYFGKAIEYLLKDIDLYPDYGVAYVTVSASFMQLGKFDEAVAYAEKAAKLNERLEMGYLEYLKSERDKAKRTK